MNGTAETDQQDQGGPLTPEAAAELIAQTQKEAERQFELSQPALAFVRAGLFFVGYGALWLSVRNQHPYTGPTGPALLVLFGAIAVLVVTSASVISPRVSGLGGRTRQQRRILSAVAGVAYTGIFVFEGALKADGFSNGLVYGIWAGCGPFLVLGPMTALYAAQHEDWPLLTVGLVLTLVATGASFASPALCWGIIGLGGGLAFLIQGGFQIWQRRR